MILMVCVGTADDHANVGQYLKAYDPEFMNGRGLVSWTADPSEAMRFSAARDAWALWKRVSKLQPVRPDGKPNRPLSAYSITTVDEDKLDDPQHVESVQFARSLLNKMGR